MTERIDKVLVHLKLVSTRSQAKQLIEQGVVYYRGKKVEKIALMVDEQTDYFEIRKDRLYASRGAHKMEGAFAAFALECAGMVVADIGASTGGFTDYVLSRGASKVYAIDVGHQQLAEHLREDARVINLEGTNIRYPLVLDQLVDLAVVDLSFISLTLTLPSVFSLVKPGGSVVALVKPQFEAGKERIGKNGIVADKHRLDILNEIFDWCASNGMTVQNACRSPIEGKSGNVEYFFYFKIGETYSSFDKKMLENL